MSPRFSTCWLVAIALACPSNLPAADDHDHDHAPSKPAAPQKASGHDEHDHGDKHDHDEHAHADEVKLTEAAVKASGIQIDIARTQTLAPTITAPARVAFDADAMAHVGSPVRGRAIEIKAKYGATVKKGDTLLVIESLELGEAQSDLIQKRAAAAVAQAATRPAKESAERAKKLYDQSEGIPLADLQKRQAESIAAEGALQTALAGIVAAENKLKLLGMDRQSISTLLQTGEIQPRYSLQAPIDGTVIQREITQGELVNPDKEALLVLADVSRLWVWADVPEVSLASVQVGSAALVHLSTNTQPIAGKVTLVAPDVSDDTRTGRVRIEVDAADGVLRPGMFVKAEISNASAATGKAELLIPERAVQWVEGKTAVFVPVEGEPTTFAKRDVQIGQAVSGLVAVRAGLKAGEAFVSDGSFVLKADLGKSGAAHEH